MRRESNTITPEVMRSLRSAGVWCYKIPDSPVSRQTGMKFTLSKPCDIIACIDSHFVAIETKLIKGKLKAFGKRHMQASQIVQMTNIVESGGSAYLFIGVRIDKEIPRLYILDWEDWGPRIVKESIKAFEFEFMEGIDGEMIDGKIHYDLAGFI